MRAWLVVAVLVIAGCAKKGPPCEGAKQTAIAAIHTARAVIETDIEASLVLEAKLAQAKLDLAGLPAPDDLLRKQDEAHLKTAVSRNRLATLDTWIAVLGRDTPAPISAAPERDEPASMITARTLMVAYAAQCAP